jgi:hypothetical protein
MLPFGVTIPATVPQRSETGRDLLITLYLNVLINPDNVGHRLVHYSFGSAHIHIGGVHFHIFALSLVTISVAIIFLHLHTLSIC